MAEIAATLESVDLPGGFFHAAGEIYERLAKYKGAAETPSAEEVIKAALQGKRV
jgi:hypothetical protein